MNTVPIRQVMEAGGIGATKTLHRWTALGILPTPETKPAPSGNGRCNYYPPWTPDYVARIAAIRDEGEHRMQLMKAAAMAAADLIPQAKEALGLWPRSSEINVTLHDGNRLHGQLQLQQPVDQQAVDTVYRLKTGLHLMLHAVQQLVDQQLRQGNWVQAAKLLGGNGR